MKNFKDIRLQVSKSQISKSGKTGVPIKLRLTDIKRLEKLKNPKDKIQVRPPTNKGFLTLSVSPKMYEEIIKMATELKDNLKYLSQEEKGLVKPQKMGSLQKNLRPTSKKVGIEGGKGIGALVKMALPFIKSTLPKILGTLGLSAVLGAISGATNKAVSGRGLQRTDLEKLMEIGNECCKCGVVKPDFIRK